jgi:hypothetical protein
VIKALSQSGALQRCWGLLGSVGLMSYPQVIGGVSLKKIVLLQHSSLLLLPGPDVSSLPCHMHTP